MLRGLEGNTWGGEEDPNLRRRIPRESSFTPIEEIPDEKLNPEEALLAKEEGVEGEDAGEMNGHTHALGMSHIEDTDPRLESYYSEQEKAGDPEEKPAGTPSQAGGRPLDTSRSTDSWWLSVGRGHGRRGREHPGKHEKGGETIRKPKKH